MHVVLCALLLAQGLFQELSWLPVGPIRGGRTKAATGVAGRPGLFYIGAVNGGVFRSDDYGRTWTPIFDDQPTGSIGAIAAAGDTIYVGSGEGLQRPDLSVGDGVYKSTDAGKTWTHLGLRDGQQIPQIALDPRDPSRLFVAVLGHPYGPNEERGIYRSTDGGRTFERVLYKDADTGGIDVAIDPRDSSVVYAALWEARQAPWENGEFSGPGSGLYKSTDGGTTWKPLTRGLPKEVGRIGLGIAPSQTSRLYASVQAAANGGLYRSDDAGESWSKITDDDRPTQRGDDFAEVKVDPRNPDVVYGASVVTWKSVDGGRTWTALRGAPGGDDYQRLWIDPANPAVILLASDQGAVVTVNGGRTWSSWFNQPTAQMFHVTADNAFPYRLCGGQQESGSACVPSRSGDGVITFRDWHPARFEEYGYAAPDPRDPDVVFGGRVTRWDRRTGQVQNVLPFPVAGPDDRLLRTQPLVFAPAEPGALYFASNKVWKTRDGGRSWTQVSGDLSRKTWEVPKNVGKYEAKVEQRGVVYALAPSPLDAKILWAGTDDGLVHVTRDGGASWSDVTPPELRPWAKVSILEAGHFDAETAYAAINTLRLDDLHPHVLRTHDGGRTWTAITNGLPSGTIVNVVREDPRRKGLLFCGTEQTVFVSFDDGEHWQSLRLDLPATSVRDLIVKDEDLAIATHGRGFFILDDLEPLRQIDDGVVRGSSTLLRPADAVRVRWNTWSDTPLQPDEPMSPNPPDGAILDYFLAADAKGPVTLAIADATGAIVRHFSSEDRPQPVTDEGNVPRWWIRPDPAVQTRAGLHRFVWDLHYDRPDAEEYGFPISAAPHQTWREPRGPWAVPGSYTVRLTVDGRTVTQPLMVRMDPRLKLPAGALEQQLELSRRLADALSRNTAALRAVRKARQSPAGDPDQRLAELEGTTPRRGKHRTEPKTLSGWNARLAGLYAIVQGADAAPTPGVVRAAELALKENEALLERAKAALPAAR